MKQSKNLMWKMTFNKVSSKKWPFINSGKQWEKICKLVQIGGIVILYNLCKLFWLIFAYIFFFYMRSITDLRRKIGIGKNRYRQVTLPKISEIKKIAIGASLMSSAPSYAPAHQFHRNPDLHAADNPASWIFIKLITTQVRKHTRL